LELFSHYRKLIEIRRKHPALVHGDFRVVIKNKEKTVYGYRRTYGDERITIVINNSSKRAETRLEVCPECRFADLLTGEEYESQNGSTAIEVEPKSGLILLQKPATEAVGESKGE